MNSYLDYISDVYSEYFRLDDPGWVKARREKWKKAREAISIMGGALSSKAEKYHKFLFLEGRVSNEIDFHDVEQSCSFMEAFGWSFPVFMMAYHPEPSISAFKEIFSLDSDVRSHDRRRDFIFSFSYFRGRISKGYVDGYGLFGGVEPLLVKLYLPEYDYRKEIIFGHHKYSLSYSPGMIFIKFIPTFNWAASKGGVCDLTPSLHLKGHFLWVMDNIKDFSWVDIGMDRSLRLMVHVIQGRRGLKGVEGEGVVKVIYEDIKKRFLSREMPDFIMDYWDQGDSLDVLMRDDEE